MHSLRAQADKRNYSGRMKRVIEKQPNLYLRQVEVVKIKTDKNKKVCGVVTRNGAYFRSKTVVLATGTYLKGKVIIGIFYGEIYCIRATRTCQIYRIRAARGILHI